MDLFGRPTGKRPAGYIPLFDEAALTDSPASTRDVTPEMRESVLREVGALTGGTLARLGDALAAPGDYARGVLSGQAGERVTGRELLRSYGLASQDDNWGNFIAGSVVDVATDPLAWLTGPAKALTPAGQAAKKLGLLDDAATVATKKAISSGATDLPMVARMNKKALEGTGRTLSTLDPAVVGRPLYGARTARRAVTFDDLLQNAPDQTAAENAARALLGDSGLDEIRNQTLAKSFGLTRPLGDEAFAVGDWLGEGFGDKYADILDTAGQYYRWSLPGRVGAGLFDGRVDGVIDAEEQLTNIANFEAKRKATNTARGAHMLPLARLRLTNPEVFSDKGNRRLGRYLEGDAVRTADDIAYVQSRPELLNYANYWINNRQDFLDEAKRAGLNANELADKYGIEYLPREADAALEMAARSDRKLNNALSVFSGDMMGRTEAMQIPGGRDMIMRLSQDPMVAGPKRTLKTDQAAAAYISNLLTPLPPTPSLASQPAVSLKQAEHIARVLNKLPEDAIGRAPLFGQHPTEMIGSYMEKKAGNIATAGVLYDSLASLADDVPYDLKEGGRNISIKDALDRLGLKTYVEGVDEVGANAQMRDRLSKILGRDMDQIELSQISVPEEHVMRLTRARDAFTVDKVSATLLDGLNHYTAAWKGAILTWPSRAVRDLYSGATSNFLEGALDGDAIFAAKALVTEGPQSQRFLQTIKSIPRYQSDDGVALFYSDLASTGLSVGGAASDLGLGVTGGRSVAGMPGITPVNVGTILSELAPQQGRSWRQFASDFGTWRSSRTPNVDTLNPLLRAGEQLNSLTDNINRLSGYIALLKKGYEPGSAAKAMMRAHVDYSNLSGFERSVMKNVFPWYSYQSKIFREVLTQLAERPGGRYSQLVQLFNDIQDEGDDDTYIPSNIRSQFAFPIPEEFGGVPAPGVQTYLSGADFPGFAQIGMLETPGTLSGALSGTARQIAMQMHPALRTGAEIISGQDFFSRRPIGESTSTLDAVARKITGDPLLDVPVLIEKPVEALPFVGRPLYAARSLLDDRGGQPLGHRLAKTGFNAFTGFRLKDATQDDVLRDFISQSRESIEPYTREFQQVYIPKDMEPNVPAWALDRMAVSRALERERREAREPKVKRKQPKATELSLF